MSERIQPVIMGADPLVTRARRQVDPEFDELYLSMEARDSIEVPCQTCGRSVLIAPSG